MLRMQAIWGSMVPLIAVATGLVGTPVAHGQPARQISVPSNTIVRLTMNTALSSRTTRKGSTFSATLSKRDRSGFPDGTRFQGVVREVQRHTKDRPGMLDVHIQRAFLPGGEQVSLNGRLASLADDDVRRMEDGRLEARKSSSSGKMDWKWAGYGAGAGAVLSAVTGGKILKGVLLGGLGGAAYSYFTRGKNSKNNYRDVSIPQGTEFGVRVGNRVSFASRSTYRYGDGQVRRVNRDRSDRSNSRNR